MLSSFLGLKRAHACWSYRRSIWPSFLQHQYVHSFNYNGNNNMSVIKTMTRSLTGSRFAGAAQPTDGIFHCESLPASLSAAGLSKRAAGILLTFVPPEADFQKVSQAWQRLTSADLTVITLSSNGALSASGKQTTYCKGDGQEGSWLWLPRNLIAEHCRSASSRRAHGDRSHQRHSA